MMDILKDRILAEARYIYQNDATVRQTAKYIGVCKSTVHKDVTVHLKDINRWLYWQVRRILDTNKANAVYRGGAATHEKWAKKK